MKIKCSNHDCEGKDSPVFNVTATVNCDRGLAENLNKIPAEDFECCYCFSLAEDDDTKETDQ